MEPDRWQRLWTAFHAALERPSGAARAEFLDAECGADAGLRAELESLLAHHTASDISLVGPAARAGIAPPSQVELEPGSRLGPYRIERKLGEGGMGLVYEATQEEPVRRRVALKIIKLGMDTRQVIARFEAERQALAMMDHPNIAKVFDAGATGNLKSRIRNLKFPPVHHPLKSQI
jgi:serine/threonine protein kinase